MLKLAWNYMRYYKSQTFAIFCSILLTAVLLAGVSSLLYSSEKNDLADSRQAYGDWHYYLEADSEIFRTVQSGDTGDGYTLEKCGKIEIRDQTEDPFVVRMLYADETYLRMMHRDLQKGMLPAGADEIVADRYVLSNLGFSGRLGDFVSVGEYRFRVSGILRTTSWSDRDAMEIFVSDAFRGTFKQKYVYLRFREERRLYKQLDAFMNENRLSYDTCTANDEVVRYLGGEKPERILDIVKFGLTQKEGNFTYIILKLQSDYHLAYHGMIALLCLFSFLVVYSVYSISAAKRTSAYGILLTLGISGKRIAGTMILELWILFLAGYPAGCLAGNYFLKYAYEKTKAAAFFINGSAVRTGFAVLPVLFAAAACATMRSLKKQTLKQVMDADTAFAGNRKIYACRHRNLAGVVVQKFLFANKRKVCGILLSLSVGGGIFFCAAYMVENLKIHAQLSMKSDDGLGSEYRISLKSKSLADVIPNAAVQEIRDLPGTEHVSAVKYLLGELRLSQDEFLSHADWSHYFDEVNQDADFLERFGGICRQKEDGTYGIKYNVYGYDDDLLGQLRDFILEGEIVPEDLRRGNQIILKANMDGQGNYDCYGKKPGDTVTLRVPKRTAYTKEGMRFEAGEDQYMEQTFQIAAIVRRPLAQEEGFLHTGPWASPQCVIMTDTQMENNFQITDYNFIIASPAADADPVEVSSRILQIIQDVPRAVLQDFTAQIAARQSYLRRQQLFFSAIAFILLAISLFHMINSMHYFILSRRREFGIMRAMGITKIRFYRMIVKIGLWYGVCTDAVLFLLFHLVLRRGMDYYMVHVVQFLHVTAGVPIGLFWGMMLLNVILALAAVMVPAHKLLKQGLIEEIRFGG